MSQFERENELLRGLADQDKAAIDQIYRNNYPSIEHLVLTHKGSTEDAADIFQESMIVLYEKSKDVNFSLQCQIKTYLYSVARRLWLKKMQQHYNRSVQLNDVTEFISAEEDLMDHDHQQQRFQNMETALQKLGEPCRSIIEAYYIKNQNMQEIATKFNYTNADNAKTQKYKCMVRLKKLFFSAYQNK